ncbi:hypothetical protein [Halopiger goleimassiliensis]|uniref:hypothetical protein n=1 Tax=Halopiger goleimassiliensis TaxID=1293048 RepID=UPI00067808D8|nr:hypothetical protein [Halopiger goleimassiliensis]
MDADDLREHYLSGRYLRNRLVLLACLTVVGIVVRLAGWLEPDVGSGTAGRELVLQLVVGGIVVGWLFAAVVGLIGLLRWLR